MDFLGGKLELEKAKIMRQWTEETEEIQRENDIEIFTESH